MSVQDRFLVLNVLDRQGKPVSDSTVKFFVNEHECGSVIHSSFSPSIQLPSVAASASLSVSVTNSGVTSERQRIDPSTTRIEVTLDMVQVKENSILIDVVDLDGRALPAAKVFARADGGLEFTVPHLGHGVFQTERTAKTSFSLRATFGAHQTQQDSLPITATKHTVVIPVRASPMGWEKLTAVVVGIIFITLLLVIRLVIPNPTQTQEDFFRTVMAISGAAFASIIPGFLEARIGPFATGFVRATGAIAVLVVFYFFNPAHR